MVFLPKANATKETTQVRSENEVDLVAAR